MILIYKKIKIKIPYTSIKICSNQNINDTKLANSSPDESHKKKIKNIQGTIINPGN